MLVCIGKQKIIFYIVIKSELIFLVVRAYPHNKGRPHSLRVTYVMFKLVSNIKHKTHKFKL